MEVKNIVWEGDVYTSEELIQALIKRLAHVEQNLRDSNSSLKAHEKMLRECTAERDRLQTRYEPEEETLSVMDRDE